MPSIKAWLKSLGWALALVLLNSARAEESLRAVTEELPPYSMLRDGKVTGMSTEVVEAILQQAGLSAPITSMPWARTYDIALHAENVLIFSLTRTVEREALFQWVGGIASSQLYLYSLAARPIVLDNLDQARAYQIGTVKNDVSEEFLVNQGFEVGKNLQSSNKYESNYEKLKLGHIDLWVSNELNAHYLARQSGTDPAYRLVPSLWIPQLSHTQGLYLACSLKTPAATVERLRAALQAIKANGEYAAIVKRWM
jgi:polar amino acid transport system substrate-binding protein